MNTRPSPRRGYSVDTDDGPAPVLPLPASGGRELRAACIAAGRIVPWSSGRPELKPIAWIDGPCLRLLGNEDTSPVDPRTLHNGDRDR